MTPRSRTWLKLLAPILCLIAGGIVSWWIVASRPELRAEAPEEVAPLVRVTRARAETVQLRVETFGSVVPRTESDLVAQVTGEVVWVSPVLVSGGFFDAGQALLRIERADYEADLESAQAALARSESEYERARVELRRQRQLAGRSVASQSRIDDAENEERVAGANLREARARVARARRDLERTELVAPFEGRVRSENVDVGQFVTRGQSMGRIYAVDYAEVRLPLPDRELRFLDLPLAPDATPVRVGAAGAEPAAGEGAGPPAAEAGPEVVLRAEFAGAPHTWRGRVVRTEGEIDPKSRMVHVVARVEDPYRIHDERGSQDEGGGAPLAVGLFVEAEIAGRVVPDAVVLPRTALRRLDPSGDPAVHVVDADGRLRIRPVEVLRVERSRVVLSDGVEDAEPVVLSTLRGVVDGMAVRVVEESAPLARSGGGEPGS